VSEREHRKIGQELHDSVCQSLVAIDFALGMLRKRLGAKAPDEVQPMEEIQELLKKSLLEARSLARGIFPIQLEKDGLAVALEELVATTMRIHQTAISIKTEGDIYIADTEVSMHLYRIAQEALSNALRHAHATNISLRLSQDAGRVTMEIQDNGAGVRTNGSRSDGMGIRTIQYRSQLIGAQVSITGPDSGGTLVKCSLNLPDDRRS
jgi:two-component system sensor kinase FixL